MTGYSLTPPTEPNLFSMADVEDKMESVIGDIRDLAHLKEVFEKVQPEIVLHLAAQPIVRDSYKDPVYTYETNVMGTVNICECVRINPCVKSFLNVTTDKVYENKEWAWGYRENERWTDMTHILTVSPAQNWLHTAISTPSLMICR